MRPRLALGVLTFGVGTWLATAACELLLPTVAAQDDGTAPDSGAADSGAAGPVCVSAEPPSAPLDGGPGNIDFLAAVRTISFADAGGFDIDGVCTCENGGPESCVSPVANAKSHCDGPGGRDIGGNEVFGDYIEAYLRATTAGDLDDRIDAGALSFLIQVRHATGGDARKLSVDFFDSSGLFEQVDAGDGGLITKTRSPSWDGGDVWALDCAQSGATCPDAVYIGDAGPFTSAFHDDQAYMTGGVLVAHLPALVAGLGFTEIRWAQASIIATVTQTAGGYGLSGQIVGRVTLSELTRTLSTFREATTSGTGAFLCESPQFRDFLAQICGGLDVAADPGDDRKGKPCGAVTFAMPFVAQPAQIGYRVDRGGIVRGCDGGVVAAGICSTL